MATCGCSRVTFFDTSGNAFYFEIEKETTDLHKDALEISSQCLKCLIRSKDNKFLLFNEGQFQAQNLSTTESGCKFNLQVYKNNNLGGGKGRAVMLYATEKGKKMVACCNDKDEIYPVEMDIPKNIVESSHSAVFYLTKLPKSNKYLFESSVYQRKFLGFEPVEHKPFLSKLVLHQKNYDEVDETCELTVVM